MAISRRKFIITIGVSSLGVALTACGDNTATPAPATTGPATTTAAATSATATTAAASATNAAAITAAATSATATSATATGDTVYFGVSGPLTGDNAEYGRIWKKGFALALDEINAAGGVKGHKLDLIFEDSQSDPKQSVPIAQKFVNDKRILAELGDFSSPASMAASSIYQKAKLVQFGFTNSHPDFTKGGDFMWSTTLTQTQQAAFMAQVGFGSLGKKHAVLYRNTDWGKVTRDIYVDKLKQLGGELVASESYLETEKDFKALLSKIRDTNPDVVILISYYNDGALIMQQAKAAGLNAKFLAAGSCYSPQFISLGGDAVNGVVLNTQFFPSDPRPEVQAFVAAFRKKYNEDPDTFSAGSYDALKVLAWAAEKGGLDRVGIQQALLNAKEIPSVLYGTFRFGEDRRPDGAKQVALQVQNGKFVIFNG